MILDAHTSYDKILPPPTAFTNLTYPPFTTSNCTWTYVLKAVENPLLLWEIYAPGNLGEYSTVSALWEAWDEGTYLVDIGRKAALRSIEERWGALKDESTKRSKLPSWRPRNDATASYNLSHRNF